MRASFHEVSSCDEGCAALANIGLELTGEAAQNCSSVTEAFSTRNSCCHGPAEEIPRHHRMTVSMVPAWANTKTRCPRCLSAISLQKAATRAEHWTRVWPLLEVFERLRPDVEFGEARVDNRFQTESFAKRGRRFHSSGQGTRVHDGRRGPGRERIGESSDLKPAESAQRRVGAIRPVGGPRLAVSDQRKSGRWILVRHRAGLLSTLECYSEGHGAGQEGKATLGQKASESQKRSSAQYSPRMWYPRVSQKPGLSSAMSSTPFTHLALFQP